MNNNTRLKTRWFNHHIALPILIILAAVLSGCPKEITDFRHSIIVHNATTSQLELKVVRQGAAVHSFSLPLHSRVTFGTFGANLDSKDMALSIIGDNYGMPGDTIEVFSNNELVIKWGSPMREMPAEQNHFFNRNSWLVESNRLCEKVNATFTLLPSNIGHLGGK